jgi:predicted NBD/HSP70 family sugar kinase
VRAHNLALVLQTAAKSPYPISRATLSGLTGLTRATVSALVDDLIAGSLLAEVAPVPRSGAGRPAVGLVVSPTGPAGLGLEINVDYLAACVVDLTGTVRHRLIEQADQRPVGAVAALAGLARLATTARELADADGLSIAGAALAVPGLVAAHGLVRVAPNLGWQDVDAPALLRAAALRLDDPRLADLPITVDNEANLAALSELRAEGGSPSFIYVSGEIGVGAGIVLDGVLYRGRRGWSGEIGHVTVDPDGRPCRCGSRGCLEQYAGQEALHDLAGAGAALGIVLAGVINMLDVDTVVLGGVYAPLLPALGPLIDAELRRRVLTAELAPITLRAAALGSDAATRGAADLVVRAVQHDPARHLGRTGRL